MEAQELDPLFNPRSVAVIGASASMTKIGTMTLLSIATGEFKGKIYPINPKENVIMGLKAYGNVREVPDDIDLAVICVPAASVPQVIKECTEVGIKFGVVITSGFAEVSEEGKKLQCEIARVAREGGMRIVGPNCMGIASSDSNLYALMNMAIPKKGDVSMISQSGTMGTLAMMLASVQGVGFNKFVSSGNEADLHLEDFIEYLADDPQTKVILFFIEGIRDGKKFLRLAKEATKKKPIIVLKGGKSELGAKAASSHTSAMAGSTSVYDAMFKQAGNIQAQDEKDMVDLVKAFTLVSPPKGRRVGFVSASGGYAVLVSDACAREGLELPQFSAETLEELNQTLPPFWSHRNPIDMTASGFGMYGGGGIDIGVLAKGVELVLRDENIDAVICMAPTFDLMIDQLTQHFSSQEIKQKLPVDLVKPLFLQQQMELVKDIVRLKEKYNKPLVFTIMTPQAERSETLEFLMGNGIPTYETPYQAVRALSKLVDYREYLMRQG